MQPCSRFSTSIEEAMLSAFSAPAFTSPETVTGRSIFTRWGGERTYPQQGAQLLERDVVVQAGGGEHVVLDHRAVENLHGMSLASWHANALPN